MMDVGVIEHSDWAGAWCVEAIDTESEGEIYQAIFAGPGAKERAVEYAEWKHKDFVMLPPVTYMAFSPSRPKPRLTVVQNLPADGALERQEPDAGKANVLSKEKPSK